MNQFPFGPRAPGPSGTASRPRCRIAPGSPCPARLRAAWRTARGTPGPVC